jgi:hypothetical protein
MNGREYLEACKSKLKVNSNYKLAIELEISESELNFYARGQRLPSVYACFKFAECLGLDPAIIIADIASESEKNAKKRNYFKSFMSTCTKAVAGILLITALLNTTTDERALSAS